MADEITKTSPGKAVATPASTTEIIRRVLKQETKIGQILLSQTSLTEDQLRDALTIQREKGGRLGEILVQRKFLQAHEIMVALGLQLGLPSLKEIDVNHINPDWVKDVPIAYARQYEVLPVAIDDLAVTVVISDPFNLQCLDDLRVIFQKEVKPVLCESRVILDAINRVYERVRQSIMQEISEENPDSLDIDLDER